MARIHWSDELSVGIEVIDSQHRRIVDYINELDDARQRQGRETVGAVIEALVDYTQSHFGFEESLMEEAGYPFVKAHKRVHELFVRRVGDYQQRFRLGDDVAEELQRTLTTWLLNHIRREDKDYSESVLAHVKKGRVGVRDESGSGWLGRALKRFFG